MIDAAQDALATLFSWPNILLPVLGTVLGLIVGAMPGGRRRSAWSRLATCGGLK